MNGRWVGLIMAIAIGWLVGGCASNFQMSLASVSFTPGSSSAARGRALAIPGRANASPAMAVPSVAPNLRSYPEFAGKYTGANPLPTLSPVGEANQATAGIKPVSLTVKRDGANGTETMRLNPLLGAGGTAPVEQLIFGGAHGDYDEPPPYTFGYYDRFSITVTDHPEFNGDLQVGQDGSVAIPNTDDRVVVEGLTVEQVKKAVAAKLAPYVRGQPAINLAVSFARSGYYYIFGEVRTAGRFPLGLKPIRLSEAVFRANSAAFGYGVLANGEDRLRAETEIQPRAGFSLPQFCVLTSVSVITPHRSTPTRQVYNVKKALLFGQSGDDPVIKQGQIIWVPSSVDKKLTDFFDRVVAPIRSLRTADTEIGDWTRIYTDGSFSGIGPGQGQGK